jgi:hypothetical protein
MCNNREQDLVNFFKQSIKPVDRIHNRVPVISNNILAILGDIDADKEWKTPTKARKLFTRYESLDNFLEDNTLILLGRTGSGKTAIINYTYDNIMVDHTNNSTQYHYAEKLPAEDIFLKLINLNVDIQNIHAEYVIEEFLVQYIVTLLMVKTFNILSLLENKSIYEYLKNNGFIEDTFIEKAGKTILESHEKYANNTLVQSIAIMAQGAIVSAKHKVSFEKAYNEFLATLQNKNFKILVLFDSQNEYHLGDILTYKLIKSIIKISYDFDTKSNNIILKLALPSEIYATIYKDLPGKFINHKISIIDWKYHDLIKFMSVRIIYWYENLNNNDECKELFSFLNKFKLIDYMKNKEIHTENFDNTLFSCFLPEVCDTFLDFKFSTLPYCIRHTLKRPREVLQIFSQLLAKIVDSKNIKYFIENGNKIKEVVHSNQNSMVSSVFSMYNNSYNKLGAAFADVFRKSNILFRYEDIKKKVSDSVKKYQPNKDTRLSGNYLRYEDEDHLFSLFLQTGLIGEYDSVNWKETAKNVTPFFNQNKIAIIQAVYEYQITGSIDVDSEKLYVIHPMCYELYRCFTNPYVMVYPDRESDMTDPIYDNFNNGT